MDKPVTKPQVGEYWKVNWIPEPSFIIILEDVIDSSDVYVYDVQRGVTSIEPWFPNTVYLWEKM